MDVFHHDLESIEASSFWNLNFSAEFLSQVLIDNAVRGCEEGKHVFDEMLLIFVEFFPMLLVLRKVNFINNPEGGKSILVHLPDVVVLDGKNNKSIWVFLKKRFFLLLLRLRVLRDKSVLTLELRGKLGGIELGWHLICWHWKGGSRL